MKISSILNAFYLPFVDSKLIKGKGAIVNEFFNLPSFSRISSESSINIYLSQGHQQEVVLKGFENLMDYAKIYVERDTLVIRMLSGKYRKMNLEVHVTVPTINELMIYGAGNLYLSEFTVFDDLDIDVEGAGSVKFLDAVDINNHMFAMITGSGSINITGSAKSQHIIVDGPGQFKGTGMVCQHSKATALGAGSIKLTVNKTLDAMIKGTGNIYFQGFPSIEKRLTGLGKLIDKNN